MSDETEKANRLVTAPLVRHLQGMARWANLAGAELAAAQRDPLKEAQLKRQLTGLVMMLYGVSLNIKDPGIAAAVLQINTVMLLNWQSVSDAYWDAKQ